MLQTTPIPPPRKSVTGHTVDEVLDRRANRLLDELAKRDTATSHAAFVRWNEDFDKLELIPLRRLSPQTLQRMERM